MVNSKRKGAVGEREFAAYCKEQGFDCRRTQQYCGNTGDAADCVGLPGIHIEVKRVQRLQVEDAVSQAVHDSPSSLLPIVAHRRNQKKWLVTMLASDWFKLYKKWEKER